MGEMTREMVQELVHLNAYRKIEGPMQASHEALFRAKVLEFAEELVLSAVEREELNMKLVKTEQCLKEAVEAIKDIHDAVSAI